MLNLCDRMEITLIFDHILVTRFRLECSCHKCSTLWSIRNLKMEDYPSNFQMVKSSTMLAPQLLWSSLDKKFALITTNLMKWEWPFSNRSCQKILHVNHAHGYHGPMFWKLAMYFNIQSLGNLCDTPQHYYKRLVHCTNQIH